MYIKKSKNHNSNKYKNGSEQWACLTNHPVYNIFFVNLDKTRWPFLRVIVRILFILRYTYIANNDVYYIYMISLGISFVLYHIPTRGIRLGRRENLLIFHFWAPLGLSQMNAYLYNICGERRHCKILYMVIRRQLRVRDTLYNNIIL